MTPKVAEAKLIDRRKRVITNRGPQSRGFTIIERDAVRCLASHAHSQQTIANLAGMSLAHFKRSMESDSKLREAYDAGISEERFRIDSALLKTALDSRNPRQVQAAMSLLKSRHGVTDGGGLSVAVQVNNILSLPSPQDARKYQAVIKRIAKQAPATIEHKSDDQDRAMTVSRDPVKVALGITQDD